MEKITITQGVPFCTIQTSCRNYPKKKFCSISLQNFWNVLIYISHNKSARTISLANMHDNEIKTAGTISNCFNNF